MSTLTPIPGSCYASSSGHLEGSFVSSGWQILDDTATTNLCSTEGNTTVPVILGAEKTTIGKITGYPVINLYTNLPIFKYGGFLLQCLDLPDGTQTT